jgi:hypothetical protein
LTAEHRGDTVVVGSHARCDRGGDRRRWNAWTPMALRGLGNDVGKRRCSFRPILLSLLVDGKEWVVPGGVAVVPDGMGGMIAVLTVL